MHGAFTKGCKWLELDVVNLSEATCHFHLCLAHLGTVMKRGTKNSTAYHPQLWWLIDGRGLSKHLTAISTATFCLFASSAGNERGFKTRSNDHNKTRNRLSDDRADKQSFVVYNSRQLERLNTVLNTPRCSPLDKCMVGDVAGEEGSRFFDSLVVKIIEEDRTKQIDEVCGEEDVCHVLSGDIVEGLNHLLVTSEG